MIKGQYECTRGKGKQPVFWGLGRPVLIFRGGGGLNSDDRPPDGMIKQESSVPWSPFFMSDAMPRTQQGSLFEQPGSSTDTPPKQGDNPPFRLEPHTAQPEDIQERNREENNKRARRYLGVERARRMAREQQSANLDRQKSWIYHPDERVVMAFLANPDARELYQDVSFEVRKAIFERGMEVNQEENIHWNPILDRLAHHNHWPTGPRGHVRFKQQAGADEIDRPPTADEQIEELIPWIRAQTDPREVEKLLGFRFQPLGGLVAQETTCVDEDFIETILETPEWGDELAENPHLDKQQVEQIVDWAMSKLSEEWAEKVGREGPPSPPSRRVAGFGSSWKRSSSSASQNAAQTLKTLKKQGHNLGSEAIDELKTLVTQKTTPKKSDRNSSYRTRQRHKPRGLAYSVLMKMEDEITPQDLLELYPAVANDSTQTNKIVEHPVANAQVWATIAQDSSLFAVRRKLGKIPEARQVEGVREVLFSSTSPEVLMELCREASPAQLQQLMDELYEEEPGQIIKLMLEGKLNNIEQLNQQREFRRAFETLKQTKPKSALTLLLRKPQPWVEYLNWEQELQKNVRSYRKNNPGSVVNMIIEGDFEEQDVIDTETLYRKCIQSMIERGGGWALRKRIQDAPDDINDMLDRKLARQVAETLDGHRGEMIVEIPVLRDDPESQQFVIEEGSIHIQKRLLPYLKGEVFRELFTRIARRAPRTAVELLEEQGEELMDRLTSDELAPLLSASDSELRQRAMIAASQRKTPEAAADAPSTPKRS